MDPEEQKEQTITVNGKTYYAEPQNNIYSPIKIVVLQRGWVLVGQFERDGNDCKLYNASVIRSWGTTKGLGEIAKDGPTSSTKLDKCYGVVEFDYLTTVLTLNCEVSKWAKSL